MTITSTREKKLEFSRLKLRCWLSSCNRINLSTSHIRFSVVFHSITCITMRIFTSDFTAHLCRYRIKHHRVATDRLLRNLEHLATNKSGGSFSLSRRTLIPRYLHHTIKGVCGTDSTNTAEDREAMNKPKQSAQVQAKGPEPWWV